MDIDDIEQSQAKFPFVRLKRSKKYPKLTFRQMWKHSKEKDGSALVVKHLGHDYLMLDIRDLQPTASGRQGDKRRAFWTLDAQAAVQLASILIYMADNEMRNSDESPYVQIVTHKEKAQVGQNFIYEDMESAQKRVDTRKSRSYMMGVMKRFVECCEDDMLVKLMAMNLAGWAEESGDEYAVQQCEKMFAQLDMIPDELKN